MVLNGNNIIIDVESLMPLNLLSVMCVNNYKTSSLKYVIDQISNSLFVLCKNGSQANLLSCTQNLCYNENTNFGKYHRIIYYCLSRYGHAKYHHFTMSFKFN